MKFVEFRCAFSDLPISGCAHCRPAPGAKTRAPASRIRKEPPMRPTAQTVAKADTPPAGMEHGWEKRALCRTSEAEPEWWDAPANTADFLTALKWCQRCPVTAQCLALAMKAEGDATARHRYGTYGGLSPAQRRELYDKRRKATA